MGQVVFIKAKDSADLNKLNTALKNLNLENSFTTKQSNIDWLNNINTNPELSHLKPDDRNLTMDELKKMFTRWTEIGLMDFDIGFNRTKDEDVKKYTKFIQRNKQSIEYIKGGSVLIERYELTPKQIKCIEDLGIKPDEPKKLPKKKQVINNLQSGQFLCRSFSPKPFWVVYGKVERPTFLKDRIYEEDLYNNIYKDKKGYAYLLVPLLVLDNKQLEFVSDVYDHAYNMGLRENYNLIIPLLYNMSIVNINNVIEDYQAYYNTNELEDRFKRVFNLINNTYKYGEHNGFRWYDRDKCFKPINNNVTSITSKCLVLTCLLRALNNKKIQARLLSEVTGKKYIEAEF